jgi:hypothetical protein
MGDDLANSRLPPGGKEAVAQAGVLTKFDTEHTLESGVPFTSHKIRKEGDRFVAQYDNIEKMMAHLGFLCPLVDGVLRPPPVQNLDGMRSVLRNSPQELALFDGVLSALGVDLTQLADPSKYARLTSCAGAGLYG